MSTSSPGDSGAFGFLTSEDDGQSVAGLNGHDVLANARGPEGARLVRGRANLSFASPDVEKQYRAHFLQHMWATYRVFGRALTVALLLAIPAFDLQRPNSLVLVALRLAVGVAVTTPDTLTFFARRSARGLGFWRSAVGFQACLSGWLLGALLTVVQQNVVLGDHQDEVEDTGFLVVGGILVVSFGVISSLPIRYILAFVLIASFADIGTALIFADGAPLWSLVVRLILAAYAIRAGYMSDQSSRRNYAALQHTRAQHAAIVVEGDRSRKVLLNILPPAIAAEIRRGVSNPAAFHPHTTAFFCDIVGFTPFAARRTPEEVVRVVNTLFVVLDDLCGQFEMEKVVTIGDAYLAVCGMPEPVENHVVKAVLFAQAVLRKVAQKRRSGALPKLSLRVGVATGPVIGAVLGDQRFFYAAFGTAVDRAMEMETRGVPDKVHVCEATAQALAKIEDALGGMKMLVDGTALLEADAAEPVDLDAVMGTVPADDDTTTGFQALRRKRKSTRLLQDRVKELELLAATVDKTGEDHGETVDEDYLLRNYRRIRCRFKDAAEEARYRESTGLRTIHTVRRNMVGMMWTWLLFALVIDPISAYGYSHGNKWDPEGMMLGIRAAGLVLLAGAFRAFVYYSAREELRGMGRSKLAFAVVLTVFHIGAMAVAPLEEERSWHDRLYLQTFIVFLMVTLQCGIAALLGMVLAGILFVGTAGVSLMSGDDRASGGAFVSLCMMGFAVVGLVTLEEKYHALFLLRDLQARASAELSKDREATENLLLNILPFHIVQTLRSPTRPDVLADSCPAASMLFVKIRGFPEFANRQSLVSNLVVLQDFVQRVDSVMLQHGLQRLKVFGTTYFAASSFEDEDGKEAADAARRTVEAALEVIDTARKHFDEWSKMLGGGRRLSLGLGVNTGPVTAGVIGKLKFQYDAWGDAVNLSARLADYAPDNTLLISEETREQLGVAKDLNISDGAVSSIKGKGLQRTFVVAAKEQEEQALQTSAQLPELNESGRRMTTITAISLEN